MIELCRCSPLEPEAVALIQQLNAELMVRYPEPGANHFRLDADEVAPGRGGFFLARVDGRAIGCGAFRLIDADTAEIKRMFALPDARGKGFGRAILATLEADARSLGVRRLVLETGSRQHEAIALYEAAGFVAIPLFGEYLASPLSVCMGKDLT